MELEPDIDAIGQRLRALRAGHGLSIRALAERAGVSTSVISEVERGKAEPSISTLKNLATALGTSITHFFTATPRLNGHVVRAGSRRRLAVGGGGRNGQASDAAHEVRLELISPDESEILQALYGRYEPGSSTGLSSYSHAGEEWAMVISGRFKVTVGHDVIFLDRGDSVWFRSNIPHHIENVSDGVSEYVWVNSPKSF
jgi:transcriptional regulator with XRE-family HTH domain